VPTTTASALADRARLAVLAGGVVLAELVLAAAVVDERLAPLLKLALAAGLAVVVLRFPLLGLAAFVVLVASALAPATVSASFGGLDLRGYEALLGLLLLRAVVRPEREGWGGTAGIALAAFLALVGISTLLAVWSGSTTLSEGFQWSRVFGTLTIFYVVVRLFPGGAHLRRALTVAAATAGATGYAALAITLGVDLSVLMGSAADIFVNEAGIEDSGTARVRLPGVALGYALFFWIVLRVLRTGGAVRARWGVVLLGVGLSLLLSFNRNMWVGVILGLAGLLALGGAQLRRPFLFGLVALVTAVSALVLVGLEVDRDGVAGPVVERGETLLDPRQVARERSLQERASETQGALASVRRHPVLGVGAGTPFGVWLTDYNGYSVDVSPQLFVHNQYLYLLVIGGVPALVAFLVFLGGTLAEARRRRRDPDVLTLTVGVGMIIVSAMVMISFANESAAASLGLVAGALVAAARSR